MRLTASQDMSEVVNITPYQATQHDSQTLAIFKQLPGMFSPGELRQIQTDLRQDSVNDYHKFVCEVAGQAVGYIDLIRADDADGDTYKVKWFAVHPQYQRTGIGKQLLEHVEACAVKNNIPHIFIETCGCEYGRPARNFYQKNNYQQCGRLPNYYQSGHDKVIFFKAF